MIIFCAVSLARKTYQHKHYLTKINRHKQYQYYFSTCCGRPHCSRQYLPRELSEQRQRQEAPVSIASTPPAASIIAAVQWKTATHQRCRSIPRPWPRSSECRQAYQQRRPTPCRDSPPHGRLNLLVPPMQAKRRSIPPPWPRSSSPRSST